MISWARIGLSAVAILALNMMGASILAVAMSFLMMVAVLSDPVPVGVVLHLLGWGKKPADLQKQQPIRS